MSTEALIPTGDRPACRPSGSLAGRVACLIEVLLAFALVHVTYRSFKHFTELGRLESSSGLNFSAGTTMILFTFTVLLVRRKSFVEYGLTVKGWRYNLNVALLWAAIILAAGATLTLTPVHLDPLHPPDLARAAVCAIGGLALTLLLAIFLMRERSFVRAVSPAAAFVVLLGLLSLPLVLAWYFNRPLLNVLFTVLWLFFGAGFGEEIFFRGYILSRVNEAFGRPFMLLGVRFGPGLIVSSLLFGFIHVLNTVDYFGGRYEFAWLWFFSAFCFGMFYGVLREKTGSVLPGAILHGLEDVLGRIPTFLP